MSRLPETALIVMIAIGLPLASAEAAPTAGACQKAVVKESASYARSMAQMVDRCLGKLSADVVQRIAGIYQSSFTRVLAPEYVVVTQPAPGVATCRFAITGVTPERPAFTPLDIIPIKAAFSLVRAATGTAAQVARVSAEIECEDSVSHKPLMAAVITGVGNRKFVEGQPITWDEVEPVLAGWAQDFKKRLDAAHGR